MSLSFALFRSNLLLSPRLNACRRRVDGMSRRDENGTRTGPSETRAGRGAAKNVHMVKDAVACSRPKSAGWDQSSLNCQRARRIPSPEWGDIVQPDGASPRSPPIARHFPSPEWGDIVQPGGVSPRSPPIARHVPSPEWGDIVQPGGVSPRSPPIARHVPKPQQGDIVKPGGASPRSPPNARHVPEPQRGDIVQPGGVSPRSPQQQSPRHSPWVSFGQPFRSAEFEAMRAGKEGRRREFAETLSLGKT